MSVHHPLFARCYAQASPALERNVAGYRQRPEWGASDQGHPWEITRLVATVAPRTPGSAIDRIVDAVGTLRTIEPAEPWQMVHGDAHRVNVALDGSEAVWFDFEDANHRPRAWDLATLHRAWPAAGDEACRQLDVDAAGFSMA